MKRTGGIAAPRSRSHQLGRILVAALRLEPDPRSRGLRHPARPKEAHHPRPHGLVVLACSVRPRGSGDIRAGHCLLCRRRGRWRALGDPLAHDEHLAVDDRCKEPGAHEPGAELAGERGGEVAPSPGCLVRRLAGRQELLRLGRRYARVLGRCRSTSGSCLGPSADVGAGQRQLRPLRASAWSEVARPGRGVDRCGGDSMPDPASSRSAPSLGLVTTRLPTARMRPTTCRGTGHLWRPGPVRSAREGKGREGNRPGN